MLLATTFGLATDLDGDGIADSLDDCHTIANSSQANSDLDSLGSTCDNCPAINNDDQSCTVSLPGDAHADGKVSSSDVIYGVNYVFRSGWTPLPPTASGDANCDGAVTSADPIHLIAHIFKSGSPPFDVCGAADLDWWCGVFEVGTAYFPSTVGSSWTFEVYDTAVALHGDTDSIYGESASMDTVVLRVAGIDTLPHSGAPSVLWQFDSRMPFPFLLDRFYTTFTAFGRVPDTLWFAGEPSANSALFRLPIPHVGQVWCDEGCPYELHARTVSTEAVYLNGQPLGEAFVVERQGGLFEGFWRRTEWVVPELGYARIAYFSASHDGGGTNYYGNRGVMYLIAYTLAP